MNVWVRYLAAAACLSAGIEAHAERVAERAAENRVVSIAVRYDDLDLGSLPDVTTLYDRLSAASWRACRDSETGVFFDVFLAKDCHAEALARAVKRFDLALLERVHLAAVAHRRF